MAQLGSRQENFFLLLLSWIKLDESPSWKDAFKDFSFFLFFFLPLPLTGIVWLPWSDSMAVWASCWVLSFTKAQPAKEEKKREKIFNKKKFGKCSSDYNKYHKWSKRRDFSSSSSSSPPPQKSTFMPVERRGKVFETFFSFPPPFPFFSSSCLER